jgi:hypothetical protein
MYRPRKDRELTEFQDSNEAKLYNIINNLTCAIINKFIRILNFSINF